MSKEKTINVNHAVNEAVHLKIKSIAAIEKVSIEKKYNSILKEWADKQKK